MDMHLLTLKVKYVDPSNSSIVYYLKEGENYDLANVHSLDAKITLENGEQFDYQENSYGFSLGDEGLTECGLEWHPINTDKNFIVVSHNTRRPFSTEKVAYLDATSLKTLKHFLTWIINHAAEACSIRTWKGDVDSVKKLLASYNQLLASKGHAQGPNAEDILNQFRNLLVDDSL